MNLGEGFVYDRRDEGRSSHNIDSPKDTAMKNVWKGMVVGALVGAGLDAAASIGRGGTELANTAAHKIQHADLPDKARTVLDDFAHSGNVAKAKDAVAHVADATRHKVSDLSIAK
jgi:guanyl-specific ribonuclease Sa